MSNKTRTLMEIVKDEEFLYASLKRKHVKVIRNVMNGDMTVEVGTVRSFTNVYIKINDCYYLRNENKFVLESV